MRDVIRAVVDDGELLELRARWAPNLVTGFATVDGRPVGIVANQPQQLAGTLDIACSHKGARFVSFCDAFNMPLVTLVDTPGFYPGKDMEWRGMIRHGAQLAFAYARATVPRVGLTLRKSYGGAFIVMDSKTMGCDLHLAWPTAEIAVMGAEGAVEHPPPAGRRRAQAGPGRPTTRSSTSTPGSPPNGATSTPSSTRPTPGRELAAALEVLSTKREHLGPEPPRQPAPVEGCYGSRVTLMAPAARSAATRKASAASSSGKRWVMRAGASWAPPRDGGGVVDFAAAVRGGRSQAADEVELLRADGSAGGGQLRPVGASRAIDTRTRASSMAWLKADEVPAASITTS